MIAAGASIATKDTVDWGSEANLADGGGIDRNHFASPQSSPLMDRTVDLAIGNIAGDPAGGGGGESPASSHGDLTLAPMNARRTSLEDPDPFFASQIEGGVEGAGPVGDAGATALRSLAPPNVSAAQPQSSVATNSNGTPTSGVPAVAANTPAPTNSAQSPVVMGGALNIRPMSMAAIAPTSPQNRVMAPPTSPGGHGRMSPMTSGSGSGSSSGSSSSQPQPDPTAYIYQSGDSDGYQDQEATSSQAGSIVTEIGGHETLDAYGYDGVSAVASIEWTVGGVEQGEELDQTAGEILTPFSSPVTVDASTSGIEFYMPPDPGSFTATAELTFVDGSEAEAVMNLNAEQPTVTSFTRTYGAMQLQTLLNPKNQQPAGIALSQAVYTQGKQTTPGNYFTAVISTANMNPNLDGGSLSVLQTLDSFNQTTYKNGLVVNQVNEDAPTDVLDRLPTDPNDYMNSYTQKVAAGQASITFPSGVGVANTAVSDSPGIQFDTTLYPQGNYVVGYTSHLHFHTYLMFTPPNGEPVAIANMAWEIYADVTFKDNSPAGQDNLAFYVNTSNWTVAASPAVQPAQASTRTVGGSDTQPDYEGDQSNIINQPQN